jgi:beta-lactamase class A
MVNQRFALLTGSSPSQARPAARRAHRKPPGASPVHDAASYDARMTPAPLDPATLDPALLAAVDSLRGDDGVVSVVARVAGEDEPRVSVDPDARHYSASVMKLPILVAAYRLAERGQLDLAGPVRVHEEFDSRVPGQRFAMDESEDSDPTTWAALGTDVPLAELVGRMITASGNLATNVVLDEVGTDEVAAVLADAGCSSRTAIVRGIEDYHARDAGIDNLITADDMARLLVALAEGRLAGAEATASCERILQAQEYRNGIPAGLPEGLVIGNKTGWITSVNHDVALVRAPGMPPVGLAVLASAPGTEEEREAGIARIATAAWALVAT